MNRKSMMRKDRFLVLHDYGSGGLWRVLSAQYKEQIHQKYGDINVFDFRPFWMTDDLYRDIEKANSFDIDARSAGWLDSLLREENKI